MSTPRGHELGHPQRFTNDVISIFRAECACGQCVVFGPRLQHLWRCHDEHLAVVKAGSMRRHPSRGEA